MEGWVCLHRNILRKGIWTCSTSEQRVILITLLLMAGYEDCEWEWKGERYTLRPGQFITSVKKIVENCKSEEITTSKVRAALERFEKLGFLTTDTSTKNTLITIVNWEKYQSVSGMEEDTPQTESKQTANEEQTNNKQLTSKPQTDGKQTATNNNINNINNYNNYNNYNNNNNDLNTANAYTNEMQSAVSAWNGLEAYGIKPVQTVPTGTKRFNCLKARLKQYGSVGFIKAVENIKNSDFLTDVSPSGWRISFDWFIMPENFKKVYDGKYDPVGKKGKAEFEQRVYTEEELERAFARDPY